MFMGGVGRCASLGLFPGQHLAPGGAGRKLNEKYKLVLQATGLTPWIWEIPRRADRLRSLLYAGIRVGFRITVYRYGRAVLLHDLSRRPGAYPCRICRPVGRGGSISYRRSTGSATVQGDYQWAKSFAIVRKRDASGKPIQLVGASLQIDIQKRARTGLTRGQRESRRIKPAEIGVSAPT